MWICTWICICMWICSLFLFFYYGITELLLVIVPLLYLFFAFYSYLFLWLLFSFWLQDFLYVAWEVVEGSFWQEVDLGVVWVAHLCYLWCTKLKLTVFGMDELAALTRSGLLVWCVGPVTKGSQLIVSPITNSACCLIK